LFLTHDIGRSYEHDEEHVAAFEGIPQYLQPDGAYIYQLTHYMFAAECRFLNVDQLIKFISIVGNIH
jgi:hypothetical protein